MIICVTTKILQTVDGDEYIISKLFHKLIAAHEYFSTSSMSPK